MFRDGQFLKEVPAAETTLADTRLSASTDYTYSVSAVDNDGNESSLSALISVRTPVCKEPAGLVLLNNRLGDLVNAPITRPDGSGAGAGATAQLFLVRADGSLAALNPATTFRTTSSAAAPFVVAVAVEIPELRPSARATLRLRAWEGPSFEAASLRGESSDFTITLGGGLVPPAALEGLRGFALTKPGETSTPTQPDPPTKPPVQPKPPVPPEPPVPPAPGNFSDIILQHEDRSLAAWQMNGAVIRQGLVWQKLEGGWRIVGSGDFNHDGEQDFLLQHDEGWLAFWIMKNWFIREGVVPMKLPEGWEIVCLGDVNGDGHTDIVLEHADATLAIWLMNGTQIREGIVPFKRPEGWRIIAAGDFDGDRKTDILLQHANRQLAFWFMDGGQLKRGALAWELEAGWRILGTSDFNRDRQTDVLLQQDDGRLAFWFMKGTDIQEGLVAFSLPPGWRVVTSR